jgi:hypothetical protein
VARWAGDGLGWVTIGQWVGDAPTLDEPEDLVRRIEPSTLEPFMVSLDDQPGADPRTGITQVIPLDEHVRQAEGAIGQADAAEQAEEESLADVIAILRSALDRFEERAGLRGEAVSAPWVNVRVIEGERLVRMPDGQRVLACWYGSEAMPDHPTLTAETADNFEVFTERQQIEQVGWMLTDPTRVITKVTVTW